MDFPHFVDVAVPDWGLGHRLDDMYAFHSHHGITAQRGQGRREGKQYYIRWCFADPGLAAAFLNYLIRKRD